MIHLQWLMPNESKEKAYQLRKEVFVEEQGFVDEFDHIDHTCEHLLLREDDTPVATARLYAHEGVYHVGRVCVAKSYRKKNLGKEVMEAVESRAKEQGAAELVLGSQLQAQAFYENCGYKAEGSIFYEQDCPHVIMKKRL